MTATQTLSRPTPDADKSSSVQAGREGKNFKIKGRLLDQRKVWDPATRLADMDTDGIETAILFGGGPLPTCDNDLYIASYEAYPTKPSKR